MKKFLALVLGVLLVASLAVPDMAAESGSAYISVSSSTLLRGETLEYYVVVSEGPRVTVFGYEAAFGSSVFALVNGSALGQGGLNGFDLSSKRDRIMPSNFTGGTTFAITLKEKDDAPPRCRLHRWQYVCP